MGGVSVRRLSIIFLIVLTAVLIGCEEVVTDTNGSGIEESELLGKIEQLQKVIEDQTTQIEHLQWQYEELISNGFNEDGSWTGSSNGISKVLAEQPWLRNLNHGNWDFIRIYRYEGDPLVTRIEDPLLIRALNLFYIHALEGISYPNGYQTDIEGYFYEFNKGSESYTVQIVDRGVMKVEGVDRYLLVSLDAHLLGKAVMPKPLYVQHAGLLAKMADSGAVVVGNQYAMFNSFRAKSIVSSILYNEQAKITRKPSNAGEKIETLTFYYYGKKLSMDVYQEYTHLHGDGAEEWYQVSHEGVLGTLSAG